MGESIVETSLRGAFSEFYVTRLPVSTGVSRALRNRNERGLQPIDTELYSWTGWDRFIDSPPMDSSFNFCSVCVFTTPVTPVRSEVITYLTTSANIDLAPGPFAANI